MALKNILVAYNGSESAGDAVRYAMVLAHAHEAHLTGVLSHGIGQIAASLGPWATPELLGIIAENEEKACAAIAANFREITGASGLGDRVHWVDASGGPDTALVDVALTYDVVVMGQNAGEGAERHHTAHPETIALESGRPVMLVPRGYAAPGLVKRAVLAWDGRCAAGRALAEAMNIIAGYEEVKVLTVEMPEEIRASAEGVVTHLARHGITAEHSDVAASAGVAQAILDYCAERGAGLLAMGAYEHSRLAEDLFGGTTRRILRDAGLPVLLAH